MTKDHALGTIQHDESLRRTDYLYRISIKCLIKNDKGEVLVVKEDGRNWWDLPGGGMDHGEDIKQAIAREMMEEVKLSRDFNYKIIAIDDPKYLEMHDFWQLRLIYEVVVENSAFSAGEDSDEIAFLLPKEFQNSESIFERKIFEYDQITKK